MELEELRRRLRLGILGKAEPASIPPHHIPLPFGDRPRWTISGLDILEAEWSGVDFKAGRIKDGAWCNVTILADSYVASRIGFEDIVSVITKDQDQETVGKVESLEQIPERNAVRIHLRCIRVGPSSKGTA